VVEGVPRAERWRAVDEWSLDAFETHPTFRDLRMKCGEDDSGRTLRLSLGDFARYAREDCDGDDSPLYIFDSGFGDSKRRSAVLAPAFAAPSFLDARPDSDLFELVGEERRPPYRWILVGPARSGTAPHVDPLGTAAWNTLLVGRKLWVLFEPGTSRRVATGAKLVRRDEDDEPINYFVDILPRVRTAYPSARRLEFVQYPGETVFVPAGWWHAVLNLEHTIGVTQNFVSRANFDDAWIKTRDSRPHMVCKWFDRLREAHRDLAARALVLGPGRRNRRLTELLHKAARKTDGETASGRRRRRSTPDDGDDHDDSAEEPHFVSPLGSDEEKDAAAGVEKRRLSSSSQAATTMPDPPHKRPRCESSEHVAR